MRSITQVLRQQARSISATAQRLQLLGDDWGVPPSDESNAACASESRAVRQKRYEEVSQATPNGRLGPGDETTVGKHGFMAGEQGGIHRDHGSCAHRRKNGSGRGRTRRAGWSWEVLEDGKLSGDAEDGVDDVCSRRGCVSKAPTSNAVANPAQRESPWVEVRDEVMVHARQALHGWRREAHACHAASSQPASLTGCRATGVWATSPVDRTVARKHHLGGHSGGRVGLEAERSSRHAVTN